MGFTHYCADLFRCGGFFCFPSLNYCRKAVPPLQCSTKLLSCFAAGDLCQKPGHCSTALHTAWLMLLYEEVRQPGNPFLLQQGCLSTSTSSPKADLDVHTLQCLVGLDLHGQQRVADVSVHCPWAFLSLLENLQGTLPLVF